MEKILRKFLLLFIRFHNCDIKRQKFDNLISKLTGKKIAMQMYCIVNETCNCSILKRPIKISRLTMSFIISDNFVQRPPGSS